MASIRRGSGSFGGFRASPHPAVSDSSGPYRPCGSTPQSTEWPFWGLEPPGALEVGAHAGWTGAPRKGMPPVSVFHLSMYASRLPPASSSSSPCFSHFPRGWSSFSRVLSSLLPSSPSHYTERGLPASIDLSSLQLIARIRTVTSRDSSHAVVCCATHRLFCFHSCCGGESRPVLVSFPIHLATAVPRPWSSGPPD